MFCCMYETLWITSDNPTMTPTFLRSKVAAFHHEFRFPTPMQLRMGPQFDVCVLIWPRTVGIFLILSPLDLAERIPQRCFYRYEHIGDSTMIRLLILGPGKETRDEGRIGIV
ncbi:hypothetical protein C8J56DRAFT_1026016 [Mycena floridula]|nr:hypothetical protein C8J56DRAFT_1026016 [Mycena floridula]